MLKAFKYRIYPNKEQIILLAKTFGCNRFLYNKMLEEHNTTYEILKDDKEQLYSHKYLTEKEYKVQYNWMRDVDSISLQQTRMNLGIAYKNFFRRIKKGEVPGYPKFKCKSNNQSFRTLSNVDIDFDNKLIKIPKFTWIKYRDDRIFTGTIRSVTISKNCSNQYFASILVENNKQLKPKNNEIKKTIALDMSAKEFAVSEDNQFINPKFYRKNEKKIKKLSRSLSKKVKGSNNRKKARLKLAKCYQKIKNCKQDWTNKLSTKLILEYDATFIEDLNIEGMKQFSSGLAKTVTLDFSWSEFVRQLEYKADIHGKYLIKVGRYFPSSKLCSECGYKNVDLTLKDRTWTCPECGTVHDRDVNASRNIKREGMRILQEIISNTVGTTEINACKDMNSTLVGSVQEITTNLG